MSVVPCGRAPRLEAGTHDIRMSENGQFAPLSLTMTIAGDAAQPLPARSTDVRSWGDDGDRTVRVGAGPASLLWMHENMNPGWEATLDGRRLTSTVVDGWQQGFEVPAGEGGDVRITFAPEPSYVAALVVGAGAALLLLVLAGVAFLTRRRWLLGPEPPPLRVPRTLGALALVAALPVAWLLGGPAPAMGLALGLLAPQTARVTWPSSPVTGAVAVALAAIGAALSSALGGSPQPEWASLLAGLGVGVLLTNALLPRTDETRAT